MAEEVKKKQSFKEWLNSHPKAVFWIRFALWVLCAAVLPFLFVAFRFSIFTRKSGDTMALTGAGIIGIVILGVFAIALIRYLKAGAKVKHPFVVQCINGVCRVIIPLCCVMALALSIRNNVEAFIQAIGCTIICELIAIPINPLPVWAWEQQKELKDEDKQSFADYILGGLSDKKKKKDK